MLPWYPHHLGPYERRTGHLTMIQHGAYRLMMDECYKRQGPLPADKQAVYRLVRAITDEERQAVDSILDQFFSSTPDGYTQERVSLELAKSADISAKRSSASRARHRTPDDANAEQVQSNCTANASSNDRSNATAFAHTPTPTSHKSNINQSSMGNGIGNGDCARVTIKDPDQRIARFQAKLAKQLGKDGWPIIFAATNSKDPNHASALRACKAAAKAIEKGWPINWPVSP
jgi:uncharacterized protein YdaU (DUF1376 family)